MKKSLLLLLVFSLLMVGHAQDNKLNGWHVKDKTTDGYYGISLEQAYQLLQTSHIKSKPVVVAVLDSGIDTAHEDLRPILWTNTHEVPGNNKDDDGNGYADDMHGWNFLGNKDGRNVTDASSEWIRVYWRYKSKYEGVTINTDSLSASQRYQYTMWQKARGGVVGQGMKKDQLNELNKFMQTAEFCDSVLKTKFPNGEYTRQQLDSYIPTNGLDKDIKSFMLDIFKQVNAPQQKNTNIISDLRTYVSGEVRRATGDKIPPTEYHLDITGDDEKNLQTKYYGNADVEAGTAEHGTHVSGIIAAVRNNNIGMNGIADNVKIMMVRTVPEGDEYDKDIALGIRYAVDNGASIISMSFGKSLSPDKPFIDEAVRYAASKNVLLVQGAGNSRRNIDAFDNFPNPKYFLSDSLAPNWITTGASDAAGMAADFSNYGVTAVDVFAPGVAIYSTIPGNKYLLLDGTSMATPVVSGVAALLRSYFPSLSAIEVKKIIEQSVVRPIEKTKKPGSNEMVLMTALCKSGGIINAYNAVKLALSYKK